ncbi:SHOCT domain-containing protein [Sporohalobacter salinus]|uniref:SHOCT domain-containing protein n=1 Tax=Sporohalobacter salinus TaxID=1494606 RepID=UPI0019616BB8|nr:SHOCT domain-containing protein [Sporohalobacter salinus]MBM7624705.1 putative membrane protein [Sporohalobacter salinus]
MMHGWSYGMRGFFGGGMLMMGLFWLVIIGLFIYLVKNKSDFLTNKQQLEAKETPIEIARKRYAKGEISKEEFQEIKAELKD